MKHIKVTIHDQVNESIKFEDNRYSVKLPLKEMHPILPDNYRLCEKRLESLKDRLIKNDELFKEYNDVIQDQLSKNIIEEVETYETVGKTTYLPHREVLKPNHATTKVRIVFDASAKVRANPSSNEILYKGPCLNPALFEKMIIKKKLNK